MTSFITIVLFSFAFLMAVGLARSLSDRGAAGEVGLDAGPSPNRRPQIAAGLVCLLLGGGGAGGLVKGYDHFQFALTLAGAVGALAALNHAAGHLQIRENGIWLFSDLIPWERVVSHRWSDDEPLALVLCVKSWTWLKREHCELPPVMIPERFRDAFDAALQNGLSDRTGDGTQRRPV